MFVLVLSGNPSFSEKRAAFGFTPTRALTHGGTHEKFFEHAQHADDLSHALALVVASVLGWAGEAKGECDAAVSERPPTKQEVRTGRRRRVWHNESRKRKCLWPFQRPRHYAMHGWRRTTTGGVFARGAGVRVWANETLPDCLPSIGAAPSTHTPAPSKRAKQEHHRCGHGPGQPPMWPRHIDPPSLSRGSASQGVTGGRAQKGVRCALTPPSVPVDVQSRSCSSALSLRMARARSRSVDPGTRGATWRRREKEGGGERGEAEKRRTSPFAGAGRGVCRIAAFAL